MEALDDLVMALLDDSDDRLVRALLLGDNREMRQVEDQVTSLVARRLDEAS